MFNCHCQDTMGKWIRVNRHKKLWLCDSCKGCKEMIIQAIILSPLHPQLGAILRHKKARLAESGRR